MSHDSALLTPANHRLGFLVDDLWMAGVCEDPEVNGAFLAFVVEPETGRSVGAHRYPTLEEALAAVNGIRRPWRFEATAECGQGNCGKTGSCDTGGSHATCMGCALNPTSGQAPGPGVTS